MNYARDIKDLSISMEALARIQGSEEYYSRICRLLDNRIGLMEDEQRVPSPSKPMPDDDEIPF